ncbi:MAG: AAA family ATPase [Myxococcota bacterium]
MPQRVHILGASGCGVTTLGRSLAEAWSRPYHDTDDFYWQPTNPPFRIKRPPEDRLHRLRDALLTSERWILGGAVDGWGDALIRSFDAVVFLFAPTETRVARLRARERKRFGDRIARGGDMHEHHERFIEWASAYETAEMGGARSRVRHEEWLTKLRCQVVRIDAAPAADEVAANLRAALR